MKRSHDKNSGFKLIIVIIVIVSIYYIFKHDDINISSAFGKNSYTYESENELLTPKVTNAQLDELVASSTLNITDQSTSTTPVSTSDKIIITHIDTPEYVRGLYISSWMAGTDKGMKRLIDLASKKEINTVVIDIKDSTGYISYKPEDIKLKELKTYQNRISDIKGVINKLHQNNIYVIGRIAIFEDDNYSKIFPESAYKSKSTGEPWKNRKGLSWIKANNTDYYNYIVSIAHDAHVQGFDEIQLDYVRFPTDGNISDIDMSEFTNIPVGDSAESGKKETIDDFFSYMKENIKDRGIKLSADVFGMTVIASDDVGIGQNLYSITSKVDYISPMIYPSHFGPGVFGYESPAKNPYEVINKSLIAAINKINASSSSSTEYLKLRPWLQDFSIDGVNYTADMINAQIKAVNDNNLKGWLMWDPANIYNEL